MRGGRTLKHTLIAVSRVTVSKDTLPDAVQESLPTKPVSEGNPLRL